MTGPPSITKGATVTRCAGRSLSSAHGSVDVPISNSPPGTVTSAGTDARATDVDGACNTMGPRRNWWVASIVSSCCFRERCQAAAAIRFTQDYVTQRVVFGQPVAAFQNTKFELAACKAKVDAAQAVVDRGIEALDAGELTAAEAASAKLFCTEVAADVIDRCLQLHGGYGFMNEYPIARLYADNRVNRIYGGTSEVMKSIISKDMGL